VRGQLESTLKQFLEGKLKSTITEYSSSGDALVVPSSSSLTNAIEAAKLLASAKAQSRSGVGRTSRGKQDSRSRSRSRSRGRRRRRSSSSGSRGRSDERLHSKSTSRGAGLLGEREGEMRGERGGGGASAALSRMAGGLGSSSSRVAHLFSTPLSDDERTAVAAKDSVSLVRIAMAQCLFPRLVRRSSREDSAYKWVLCCVRFFFMFSFVFYSFYEFLWVGRGGGGMWL
jgi:hypothetical protein